MASEEVILQKLEGFDTKTAVAAMAGKVSLYLMIIKKFVGMYAEDMPEKIEALLAANDLESLRREAHTIKGLAGSIGHPGLQSAALALENAAKAEAPADELNAASTTFLNTLAEVIAKIQAALAEA
ncbi:MAG: Hpt domain-containing protein [Desulfovibrionaceae bacterium]|nr:Hpt domain-containing protein [Desulfovibrionaceae bacterium]